MREKANESGALQDYTVVVVVEGFFRSCAPEYPNRKRNKKHVVLRYDIATRRKRVKKSPFSFREHHNHHVGTLSYQAGYFR